MKTTPKPIATQFVKGQVIELETLKDNRTYILCEKVSKGEKLSRAEKNWITSKLNHNSYFKKAIPLMGYRFDFSAVVKTFLVKQYDHWCEYTALDKTSLRAMLYGKIDQIIEIK